MRIAIDAHTVGCRKTGNEVYISNLINELNGAICSISFDAYRAAPATFEALPPGFSNLCVSQNPFRRLGWDLPLSLGRRRPDVLHVQYTAPVWTPAPVVVTVHDVSFAEHPEFFHPLRAAQLRRTVARTVAAAARVIAPSEFSRQGILRHYGLNQEKVVTIPNGVSRLFRPGNGELSRRWIARKYGVTAPFVLAVGNIEARKNPLGLVHAFADVVKRRPDLPHHLVFAGKDGWKGEGIRRAARRSAIADRIHFTGYVPGDDLRDLYAACQLFVFPSLYEGFGLPILEAMASGRAVACSAVASMPEVAGAAARYFDPHSPDAMASVIAELLTEDSHRARLEQAGVERARSFSWARAARTTLEVYRSATRGNRPQVTHADRLLLTASAR